MRAFPHAACLRPGFALLLAAMLVGPAFGAAPAPKRHDVVIEGMKFTPPVLQVAPGDTVTWTNKDFVPHNVTAREGGFRSGVIQPGQSWTLAAKGKGELAYFCSLHPGMKATLAVGP